MSLPFDATLKEVLTAHPEEFVAVFGLPQTQPAVPLNIDLSTLSAATDVALGFGEPLQEIVDLNFQSGPDSDVDKRCHLYNAALHYRYHVPVRTVLVMLRPKADAAHLTGNVAYGSGSNRVEFCYEVVRLWQRPVAPFLQGGVHLLPLATLCQLPAGQSLPTALRQVVQEIDRRLVAECEHAQAVRLMTAAFILSGLRIQRPQLRPIYEGVRVMHESTAWDEIEEIGVLKALRKVLLLQGQKRFGPPDAFTRAVLDDIKDPERLERLAEALLSAASWKELILTS